MSSREKYKQIGQAQITQKKSEGNNRTNNIKSYTMNKVVIEKSTKTTYTNVPKNKTQSYSNQSQTSQYQTKNQIPVIKNQTQNTNINQSQNLKVYEYYPENASNVQSIGLKHHPNQVNNLIHNHKFYTSVTSKTEKNSKTSKSENKTRSERSERIQSLSPIGRSKYVVETKKVELFSKPRYSSVSSSSRETNISISKSQVKRFITKLWLEESYCSNVESLCCLVDNRNSQKNNNSIEIYERELEQKTIIIKDCEAEILKLKSILNIKEQEMQKLVQNLKQKEQEIQKLVLNLKQNESAIKVKNQKLYEYNVKTVKKNEILDKDAHELQIISTKKEKNKNEYLDKDTHSLEIISLRNRWNGNLIPSPVNEIYIQTVINANKYEEIRKIQIKKEEEIRKRQLEKIYNFECQEMGTLSIISKKPKKINLCQHLQSIMILSKEKVPPLKLQKTDKINIGTPFMEIQNEIQELGSLEIIHRKKNQIFQEQSLNGLEIQREYDMLLVKPVWDSLKIQGSGLNFLALPRNNELENQEIDEFEILGTKPEKINVLIPIAENNMQKIANLEIIGKVKMKPDFKIKKERIKLEGIPKKEPINWNEVNRQIKTTKLLLKRNYEKIEPKKEIDWNELLKPFKTTKLAIKGLVKKEVPMKMVKKDKINFFYSAPEKGTEKLDIEKFSLALFALRKGIKKQLKVVKEIEKKKVTLIKNRIDSINIFGLKQEIILIPSSTQNIKLVSETIEVNKNWDEKNKVMKTRILNIPKKIKTENKIGKKVVNIEIKSQSKKEIIFKPIKTCKLFIKRIEKQLVKKPSLKESNENKIFIRSIPKQEEKKKDTILKPIKENKLFIRSAKKVVKKPEIILKQIKENKLFIKGLKTFIEKPKVKTINWSELIKVQKISSVNLIHKKEKGVYKKQNLNAFSYKGIQQVQMQKKSSEKIVIKNNWADLIKAQRNSKFIIKGKIKTMKLLIVKGDKFTLKREPEEEIIFNDDYNYLSDHKKENGKAQNEKEQKIVVIKEKEITPIIQREIRAQVIRVKEESSEASSQSDIDILGGIKKKGMLSFVSSGEAKNMGYHRKVINGEVIFTPKSNLGVNLGGAKYKKEIVTKKGIVINKKEQGRITGIEISGNNGQVFHERMSGIGGAIKEGSYLIMNGNTSELNNQKKLTSLYQSTVNIRKSNKTSKVPNDSKKKISKQTIVKKKLQTENIKENNILGNMTSINKISEGMANEGKRKIIIKSNLTNEIMRHSSSSSGLRPIKGNITSVRKEETYVYEHRDNGNFNNSDQ